MDGNRRMEWAAAASVDDAVKRIVAALKTAGVYDNTVMIFTTDNGYSFGEHRWSPNAASTTRAVTRRCSSATRPAGPLLLVSDRQRRHCEHHKRDRWCDSGPPSRRDELSRLLVGRPLSAWRDSLLLHWPGGDSKGQAGRTDSIPQFWGVRTEDWKYVEVDGGDKELYDEVNDPYELGNLAGKPEYLLIETDLKRRLDAFKAAADAPAGPLRTDIPVPGDIPVALD